MTIHLIAIGFLALAFVLATVKPLNLGAIAFVGVFLVGSLIAGLGTSDLYSGFPGSLVVVLVGVTYLFNVANANGTVDWLVGGTVKLVKGRNALVPWIMFAAAGLFSAIGAAFAVPIVAPMAMAYAAKNKQSQVMMGLMVIHGSLAGALSPISLYGVIVRGVLESNNYENDPMWLFSVGFIANLSAATIVFTVLTMLRSPAKQRQLVGVGTSGGAGYPLGSGRGASDDADFKTGESLDPEGQTRRPMTVEISLTLTAILLLVVLGVAFRLDVGLLAFTLCILVGLHRPEHHKEALTKIPWSVVLLVCGVLTYVGVLQKIGTIDFVGGAVSAVGIPLIATLILGYIGGVISAFATSSGVIAALVPLAMPLLEGSGLAPMAVVALLAVTSTIVDVSPFSTNGAVVVANATPDQQNRIFKQLLMYGGLIVAVVPPVLWGVLILPQ